MPIDLDADVLHRSAIAEFQRGNAAGALDFIDAALRAQPRDPAQHQTRGQILRGCARRPEALTAFARAVELAPDFADARASLGHALLETGNAEAAREHLQRAVRLRPQVAEWLYNLALAQAQLGGTENAIAGLRQALALRPAFAQAAGTLGVLLAQQGDLRGAEEAYGAALRANPAMADAHNNLGNVLRRLGRGADAEQAFRRATRCEPPLAAAWSNLGNCLRESDGIDEALACFEQALRIDPASPAAHFSLAITRLLAGDYAGAWAEYRWRRGEPPDPAILGAVLERIAAGALIELQGEQGLGDALFFLRWAQGPRRSGARFALRADPRLFALLEGTGLIESFTPQAAAPSPEALALPLGDLPWIEQARGGEPIPAAVPLRPSQGALEAARAFLSSVGPPPYVGIAWRAGLPREGPDERISKNVPPAELGAALGRLPGTLVSIQRNPPPGEREALGASAGRDVADASAFNSDLPAMLALMDLLDDYVGVSSTNVHLREGLGKGARVLVPLPPEWRYGRAGAASPWFARMRLYRERPGAGWTAGLADLARDLGQAYGAKP